MNKCWLPLMLAFLLACATELDAAGITDLNLFFSSRMEAKVYIDNNYLGIIQAGPDRPHRVPALAEGTHTVKAVPVSDDYNTQDVTFSVKVGTVNSVEIFFEKKLKYAYLIFRSPIDFPALTEYRNLPITSCRKCGKKVGDPIGMPESVYMAVEYEREHDSDCYFFVEIKPDSCFGSNFNMHGNTATRINSSNYTSYLCEKSLYLNYKRILSIVNSGGKLYIQSKKFEIKPGEVKIAAWKNVDGYKSGGSGFFTVRLAPRTKVKAPETHFTAELGKTLVVTAHFSSVGYVYVEGHLE